MGKPITIGDRGDFVSGGCEATVRVSPNVIGAEGTRASLLANVEFEVGSFGPARNTFYGIVIIRDGQPHVVGSVYVPGSRSDRRLADPGELVVGVAKDGEPSRVVFEITAAVLDFCGRILREREDEVVERLLKRCAALRECIVEMKDRHQSERSMARTRIADAIRDVRQMRRELPEIDAKIAKDGRLLADHADFMARLESAMTPAAAPTD